MNKRVALPLLICLFYGTSLLAEHQVAPTQQKWIEVYAKQRNLPEPGDMLLNTDAEPDLTEGFVELYDGESLDGWVAYGGTCTFEPRGDAIVGTCVPGSPSTYLSTTKDDYRDFIFTVDVLWEVDGNTGVMFRSRVRDGEKGQVAFGPQAEMEDEAKQRFWSGGIYGQASGGWAYPLWLEGHEDARNAINRGEWNRLTIMAVGDTVKTWINGVPAAHWETDEFREGFFGLQVHSGKQGTIHFRAPRVRELIAEP
ncbi:MAG: DUF1080 domain-containing protein [Planctomycetota bacterium]